MNEALNLILAFSVGITLGVIFFAGLWWTVRHGLTSEYPSLCFLSSLLLRSGITLTGFYYIAMASSKMLIMCLFGFSVAHHALVRLAQTSEKKSLLTQET